MSTMESENLLNQLGRLEDPAQRDVAAELRAWCRIPVRAEAELYPIATNCLDRSPIEVALRDISWDGLGLLSAVPLESDSRWRCSFLRDGQAIAHQSIVVVYCRAVSTGVYHLGGQFVLDSGVAMLLGADVNALGNRRR